MSTVQAPTSRRRKAALIVAALAAVVLVIWLLRPQDPGRPFEMNSPTFELLAAPKVVGCDGTSAGPFSPTRLTIPGVVRDARVLALPRDKDNVPGVPPKSAKQVFAWDRPPGIEPGTDRGNVLLNAHTWPDGSAVGNVMLDKLDEGAHIILSGGGSTLCYTVTQRIEVLAKDGYSPYYDREGSPKVALIVCSGKRLSPGVWTHRTIWFAEPLA